MQSTKPKNQIEVWLNNKKTNLNTPKKPIFNTILANKALISVFTSTCTSGNQICNGHIGYFIANIKNKSNHIKIFKYKLSKKQISTNVTNEIELKCKITKIQNIIQRIELIELKIIKK